MNIYLLLALIAIGAYFLGGLNFSLIVTKWLHGEDIRKHGSGNAGATNMLRVKGVKWALIVSGGDFGKGLLAVWLARVVMNAVLPRTTLTLLWHDATLCACGWNIAPAGFDCYDWRMAAAMGVAGLFVMLGHIFPPFFGFRGGKGIWTFGATVLIFDWRVAIVAIVIFTSIVVLTRYVSLGSILGAVSVPVTLWLMPGGAWSAPGSNTLLIPAAILLSLIAVVKHHTNIKKLIQGNERKIGQKASDGEVDNATA